MEHFLSPSSIARHRAYAEEIEAKLSILAKSDAELHTETLPSILSSRVCRSIRREAIALRAEADLHRLYFSSFSDGNLAGEIPGYSSVREFLYEIFEAAMKQKEGFLLVSSRFGHLYVRTGDRVFRALLFEQPLLAVDLCEHAYVSDYGMDLRSYLRAALPYLAFEKVAVPFSEKKNPADMEKGIEKRGKLCYNREKHNKESDP